MAQDRTSHELYQQAHARLGTTLKGKWRLDALIGVGGMAAVYAATHRNGLRVAVKLLHPALSLSSSVHERFRREGYAANNVDHAGVARVLDDDETDEGEPFLVMELLAGETLDTRWRRAGGRMPPGEVLAVAQALLDVLHAAHEGGVLHRDIKPENIFLTSDGQLKLLDFGIARMRDLAPGGPSFTRTGAMLGTPAFMAPEQARGRNREIDARADVWAVGATLFTLLTGRYVHQGETPNEILIKTATEAAAPLLEVLPEAPPVVAGIIDRSLAFKADDRFESARAMREAVLIALRDLELPWSPPAGEPGARPASFPDVAGATVESAPPCAEPPPEGTPGPALFSVAPPPMSSPLEVPPYWRRPAALGAALLAAAACFAVVHTTRHAPAAPAVVAAAPVAAASSAPVAPATPSAAVAVEALPVASAAPVAVAAATAAPTTHAPPVSAPRASKPKSPPPSKPRR